MIKIGLKSFFLDIYHFYTVYFLVVRVLVTRGIRDSDGGNGGYLLRFNVIFLGRGSIGNISGGIYSDSGSGSVITVNSLFLYQLRILLIVYHGFIVIVFKEKKIYLLLYIFQNLSLSMLCHIFPIIILILILVYCSEFQILRHQSQEDK